MKMKSLLSSFAIILIIGGAVLGFLNAKTDSVYTPRTNNNSNDAKGMEEWFWKQHANLSTGKIDYEYMSKMDKEMAIYNSKKATNDFTLEWIEMGPDKVGGRTRAILIDKNNTNTIYVGSVSGGLWKSTDGGGSWIQVNSDASNLVISSIVQTDNGDIYYGTGEQFGTGFRGDGIWKSTDNGSTFTQLSSTTSFTFVNKMVVDNANFIYAATNNGLYRSEDAGATWTKVYNDSYAIDVKLGADGTVYAVIGGEAYKSATGASGTFTQITGFNTTNASRIVIAPAPSNADYLYCSVAYSTHNNPFGSDYNDFDIFRSTDKGETWTSIRGAYVESFQPFKHQANYDNIIAVFPNDENKILLGGIELFSWNSSSTAWEKVSIWTGSQEINYISVYMHADLHEIVFDPNYTTNSRIYFGNDGGIFVSNDGAHNYTSLNLKYNVTQFYDIGCGPEGEMIAGAQDNGTQYNSLQGVNKQRTTEVLGGDGFSADISKLNNDILFGSLYYGEIDRIISGETQQMNAQNGANPFITDFDLWESFYDPNSIDSIYYMFSSDDFLFDNVKDISYSYDSLGNVIDTIYIYWKAGDTITGRSACDLKPIEYILQEDDYNNGDTIFRMDDIVKIHDTYQAALAVGLDEGLKITSLPVSLALSEKFRFIRVVAKADIGGIPENIKWSSDGDIIYFSVGSKVYRASNIIAARELLYIAIMRKKATVYDDDKINLQLIGNFSGYNVSSIAVDPNVSNNVLVTLGGYDAGSHIYFSTNAAVTNSESTSSNFTSVQGSLPEIPAFSSLIAWNDSRKVVVGTEYGIYTTDDITSSPVTWVLQNSGLPKVATYSLTQERFPNSWEYKIFNHGYIYAATFGRGAFRSESNAGPVDVPEININSNNSKNISNINIYPNPVSNSGNIKINLKKYSKVEVSIYSLSGQKVYSNIYNGVSGENIFKFSVEGLNKGAYFVKINSDNNIETKKIVVN